MKKEQREELLSILIVLIAVYFAFSLFTYNEERNPILKSVAKDNPLIGQIGMVIAWSFKVVAGWAAYLVPVIFLFIAIRLFTGKLKPLKDILGAVLLLITLSMIFGLFFYFPNVQLTKKILYSAGYLGFYINLFLFGILGRAGIITLAFFLLLTSLFLMTDFLLKSFFRFVKNKMHNLTSLQKEKNKEISGIKKEKQNVKRVKRKEKKTEKKEKKRETPIKETKIDKETEEFTMELKPPPIDILSKVRSTSQKENIQLLEDMGKKLIDKLSTLSIEAELKRFVQGPTVTRYEITLAPGTRISQIASVENDISYALGKSPVRILAPIPGKNAIGVEIPNDSKRMITMREVMESEPFTESKGLLNFGIGCTVDGNYIIGSIEEMPHILIAGSTGSGKSVMIKVLITSLLLRFTPHQLRFLLVDPKRVELTKYKTIPHLIDDIIVEPKKTASKLADMVKRMEFRLNFMSEYGINHISKFNEYVDKNKDKYPELKKMPYIVVIIDELADLMMLCRNEVETSIARLAQLARSVGIHLVLATQRPSVDVITGVIKANFPVRMAFRVAQKVDSRTIFDKNGAEALLGKGDLLYLAPGSSDLIRAQAPFPADDEIDRMIKYWSNFHRDSFEDWERLFIAENSASTEGISSEGIADELFVKATEAVIRSGNISTSYLQTLLAIGYNRAARLIFTMEESGIISKKDASGKRKILITEEKWQEIKQKYS